MTNKELSMRLKKAGFTLKGSDFSFHCKKCNIYDPDRYTMTSADGSYECYYHCVKCNTELDMIDLYDAEVLLEWLMKNVEAWEIFYDGIAPYFRFLSTPESYIAQGDGSLADMLAESIIWILGNKS